MSIIKHWLRGENGATAIEYVLIASGIAVVISGTVYAFGDVIANFYSTVYNAVFK